MTLIAWSQDTFSKGELSPLMYSRVTLDAYFKGLKKGRNVISYPQGGMGKRFGTLFLNEISGITSYKQIFFDDFQYLTECTYILVFIPDNILIYLEGILIATVTSTGIVASEIPLIDSTVLENRFRVTCGLFAPKDLIRSSSSANVIASVSTTEITLTTPVTAGLILPTRFSTSGSLPTTNPQIRTNKTYFIFTTSTTTAKIYSSAEDAKADINSYTISDAGTGTNNAIISNTWNFTTITFKNLPVYDFTGGYDALTFTPGATTGYNVTLTASGSIFTSGHIGGAYVGNGGIGRIISVSSGTVAGINIMQPFDSTAAIPGSVSLLTEPAWSDSRGWPLKCSSFQSRAVFANTDLLPNGIWLSAINDFNDFNDLQTDDDDAISWFPSSDNVNAIRFIVPYRSLTIHTNTGIYSTPLSFETALTPNNFSMTLQDSTPATAIQPRGIDNQIVVISGNDVHSMIWDGFNSAYTSTIASIASENLINSPHDESEYTDLNRAGSRYMFIINDDGGLVIFQTLIAEDVQGFTLQNLDQPYGNAYFRWATASSEGRAWFVTERQIAAAAMGIDITANTASTLTATGSAFSTTDPLLITFTTTGTLPTTEPQIVVNQYYWALGITTDTFKVYETKQDALDNVNDFDITNFGSSSKVVPWPLSTKFYLEELSFDLYVDCATVYSGSPTSTISGLSRFNGQDIVMNGDGFGFKDQVIGNTATFELHSMEVNVSEAQLGFKINSIVQPLPVAPPGIAGNKSSPLVYGEHVRTATFMFVDTIGGFINNTPLALTPLPQIVPGNPPIPQTGIMKLSFMSGWNEFQADTIVFTHSDPFEFKLIGIFYQIEVS